MRIPVVVINPNSLVITSNSIAEVTAAVDEAGKDLESTKSIKNTKMNTGHDSYIAKPQRPRRPESKTQESWAWTPPRSPRPSLIPSPLLPSVKSQDMKSSPAPQQPFDSHVSSTAREGWGNQKEKGVVQSTRSNDEGIKKALRPGNETVTFEERTIPPSTLPEADTSILRFAPRTALFQMEPSPRRDPNQDRTTTEYTVDKIELSPHRVPQRKSRPTGIFFDRDLSRITLPKEPLRALPKIRRLSVRDTPQENIEIGHVDGEHNPGSHNPLSSTLAEEASHEDQGFANHSISQSLRERQTRSVSKPSSVRSRASRTHRRGRSRVAFVHSQAASSAHQRRCNFPGFQQQQGGAAPYMNPSKREASWESIDVDLDEGPGPDVGDNDTRSTRRYESMLKVENWDNGSPHSQVFDPSNVF